MDRTSTGRASAGSRRIHIGPVGCALLLLIACGGDNGSTSTAPAPPPPTPAPEPPAAPDGLRISRSGSGPFGPAEAGKRAPEPIAVTVLDAGGSPAANVTYQWEADGNAGWVYPPEGVTAADGGIAASWVPGSPGAGVLTLTVGEGELSLTAEFETRSVASRRPPSGAIYVFGHHSGSGTGYSIDLTPLAEPHGTYYAAIQWDGGYAGLQRGGTRYDRQLQFSVWDAPGGVDARLIRSGDGAVCSPFGGEGTGRKCELHYPWRVGATYRFEVTEEELDGGSAMTLHVTDLATGERRFVGTLRYGARANTSAFAMFVEDFVGTAATCLAQPVRSAAIRRVMVRLNGVWQPIARGVLQRASGDANNPGTPACANLAARDHPSGLEIAMGGRTAMDPDISRVTIPE